MTDALRILYCPNRAQGEPSRKVAVLGSLALIGGLIVAAQPAGAAITQRVEICNTGAGTSDAYP